MSENDQTAQRQICEKCGSEKFHINHHLQFRRHDRVYLECAECGHFSARLIVHAYVDPEPDSLYHRYLKEARRNDHASAKNTLADFEEHAGKALEQFEEVKEMIKANKAEDGKKMTIGELYAEYQIKEDG